MILALKICAVWAACITAAVIALNVVKRHFERFPDMDVVHVEDWDSPIIGDDR